MQPICTGGGDHLKDVEHPYYKLQDFITTNKPINKHKFNGYVGFKLED